MSVKKVMVVEDDDDIRENVIMALEAENYEVLSAANGKEALESLTAMSSEELPSCIILDLMMPVMTGKEFLEEIQQKHQQKFKEIHIVVATAKGSIISSEVLPGISKRIRKPFNLDELYAIVGKYCGLDQRP